MKSKKKQAIDLAHTKENIPVRKFDMDVNCFLCQHEEKSYYLDIYQVNSRDLENANADDIEVDIFTWTKFYKTYGFDCQIVTSLFPCDTSKQQQYWKKVLEENQIPYFHDMIEQKIEELEWREKYVSTKEFYLFFYIDKKSASKR